MTDRRGRRPSTTVVVAGIAVVVTIIALVLALRTGRSGETAVLDRPDRTTATPVPDRELDLGAELPEDAEPQAGEWTSGPDGATVTSRPPDEPDPLLTIPLGGPPWATVTVEGEATEGWSVAFGVEAPGTYWAATLRPGAGQVELVRVRDGQADEPTTLALAGPARAEARLVWQGRFVQVDLSGVALPTVTVAASVEPAVGLVGRGAATSPGAARWTSVTIEAREPLAPALLPPLWGARHVSADEARQAMGG